MISQMLKYLNAGVDQLLSPAHCMYCLVSLERRDIYCKKCFELIRPVPSVEIKLSERFIMQVYAISRYHEPIKSLILAKAYSNYIASKQLAQLIWRFTAVSLIPFDYLVAVPLHWTRALKRGYNQAEIMAQELAQLSGKPVLPLLKRTRRTAFQSQFSKVDREKNVQDVFSLTSCNFNVHDKTILLIDDLLTTGATIKNSARVLTALEPKKIVAAVGARA